MGFQTVTTPGLLLSPLQPLSRAGLLGNPLTPSRPRSKAYPSQVPVDSYSLSCVSLCLEQLECNNLQPLYTKLYRHSGSRCSRQANSWTVLHFLVAGTKCLCARCKRPLYQTIYSTPHKSAEDVLQIEKMAKETKNCTFWPKDSPT